jgi:hypothetical protein
MKAVLDFLATSPYVAFGAPLIALAVWGFTGPRGGMPPDDRFHL